MPDIISNAVGIDRILFPLEILLIVFLSKFAKGVNSKILILLYGLITISPYNIFVEYIKDYGIVIPRNFIFKYQILGSLNIIDVVSIFLISFFNYKLILSIRDNQIVKLYFIKSFLILIISLFSLLLFYIGNGSVDWRFHFSQYRGLILTALFFYIFSKTEEDIKGYDDLMTLLRLLIIIDFINIFSEIILAPYFEYYLWGRGGHPVTTLDQSNSILAMSYLPALFVGFRMGLLYSLFGYFMIIICLYDYIKSFYIILPTFITMFIFISIIKNKISISKIIVLLMIFCLTTILVLPNIFKDHSVATTRSIQLNSYFSSIKDSPVSILLGTGYGSKYEILSGEQDFGSTNKIDRDIGSNYQTEFQVPFLWYFKSTGIVGLLIVLVTFLISFIYVTRLYLISVFSAAQLLVITIISILDDLILSPDPNSSFYISRMFFFSYILLKNDLNNK